MNEIKCYDSDSNVLTKLHQWDANQTITIVDADVSPIPAFHFCNRNSKNALVVTPTVSGTHHLIAKIPNVLLQQPETIILYIYQETSSTRKKTVHTAHIPVIPRPRPDDYEYEENVEYISLSILNARLRELRLELEQYIDSEATIITPKNILDLKQDWLYKHTFKPTSSSSYTIPGETIRGDVDNPPYNAQYHSISSNIPVVGGKSIITSRLVSGDQYTNLAVHIVQYNSNGEPIIQTDYSEGRTYPPEYLVLDDDTKYIRIAANSSYVSPENENTYKPQIEYGTSRTAFESYFKPYSINDAVVCWGDSLTYCPGVASGKTYPEKLSEYIRRPVQKFGFPGDNSAEIAGYHGAMPLVVKPCTIGFSGATVDIYSYDMYDGFAEGGSAFGKDYPFRYPSKCASIINPVTIAGIEGTLDLSAQENTDTRRFNFTRTRSGSAVTLKHDTPLICNCSVFSDCIPIVWIGTNGGWWNNNNWQDKDINILISQIKLMVENNKKYIVIGLSAGINETNNAYDKAMLDAFGGHFVNPRQYLSKYGIDDWNASHPSDRISATPQDTEDKRVGRVPRSLKTDETHYNDKGCELIAKRVYEQGQILGYWE